jgi:hypothetical protein
MSTRYPRLAAPCFDVQACQSACPLGSGKFRSGNTGCGRRLSARCNAAPAALLFLLLHVASRVSSVPLSLTTMSRRPRRWRAHRAREPSSMLPNTQGPLFGYMSISACVKGLRCGPLCSADGEAPGPASESLQGRKPRPGAVRYGDFAARLGLRERARRVTAARCSDRDARKPRVCCTWEGSGIAAGCISAIEPNGIARSLAETGSASSGCRRCAIVMRCRS